MKDLIDTLLDVLGASDDGDDEWTVRISLKNKPEETKEEEKPCAEKKVATGASPECTTSWKTEDKKASLTNDKEEYEAVLKFQKDNLRCAHYEYDKDKIYCMDMHGAALFGFVRLMGEQVGMTGEELEEFVVDYGLFLSDKLPSLTREFIIKKAIESLKGMTDE